MKIHQLKVMFALVTMGFASLGQATPPGEGLIVRVPGMQEEGVAVPCQARNISRGVNGRILATSHMECRLVCLDFALAPKDCRVIVSSLQPAGRDYEIRIPGSAGGQFSSPHMEAPPTLRGK